MSSLKHICFFQRGSYCFDSGWRIWLCLTKIKILREKWPLWPGSEVWNRQICINHDQNTFWLNWIINLLMRLYDITLTLVVVNLIVVKFRWLLLFGEDLLRFQGVQPIQLDTLSSDMRSKKPQEVNQGQTNKENWTSNNSKHCVV